MLFIPIIGGVLLSVGCNLAAAWPTVEYAQLMTPELKTLYEAMEHAIAEEKPAKIGPDTTSPFRAFPDVFEENTFQNYKDLYNKGDVLVKLDYLEATTLRELKTRIVASALKYFATNFQGQDNVEPVQRVKDACNTLAANLKTNKIQRKPESPDRYYLRYARVNKDLLMLINLDAFCSIIEGSS